MLSGFLFSCGLSQQEWLEIADRTGAREHARAVLEEKLEPYTDSEVFRDVAELRELLIALEQLIESIWGKDEKEVSSDKRLVKYSNDYQARAIVDFERGYLRVETIATENPREQLQRATQLALLTPKDLSIEDIFSDRQPQTGAEPFLLGQVLDHEQQPIRYEWRANRFADYLVSNHLQQQSLDDRRIYAVQTPLVDNHLKLRQLQFSEYVLASAQQYQVSPALVYAVIEVESSFNPYAVSHANAFGLMQVVPATAGRDVFEKVKKIAGEPTRQQLFQPDFNIDIGSAYLYLLDDLYLPRVLNPQSRRYAMISAYNGGAGNVFRAFSADRETAVRRINSMTPDQVYQHLTTTHPFAETRRYLEKVQQAVNQYQ
ncbi:DUF3393 domain-containing protein [Aliidiomarina minuta]|uniref:DUF3393 domain-containing protein n=2 Tax=Aliidiomarina minuta TaxID=880057 RepID=A0A432WAF6_9GAMM|nr:DUF3393 domain-containing protein [Aliidiomarina minuta]